jgi:aspartate-semialdehyde dehydrogenase
MPEDVSVMKLSLPDTELMRDKGIKVIFSALPSSVAVDVEPRMRDAGFPVFSNASAMRYDDDVPILVPEINGGDIDMILEQGFPGRGFIVTNANCTTTGLAVALAPLREFGIRKVFVSTYQALSGAGHSGFTDSALRDNAVPWIDGEEDKISRELGKILKIFPKIFPFCVRVPVPYGHLETVWVEFENGSSLGDIERAWEEFAFDDYELPSLGERPVLFSGTGKYPTADMSFSGDPPGMQVFTGRLKEYAGMTGFVLLSNNIIKGAAGGSVENAELFIRKYGELL